MLFNSSVIIMQVFKINYLNIQKHFMYFLKRHKICVYIVKYVNYIKSILGVCVYMYIFLYPSCISMSKLYIHNCVTNF